MYSIKAILLDDCSYSIAAKELLTNLNINHKAINITRDEMDKYITSDIDTFPQIYLKKQNSKGNLLLGGYDDLNNFIQLFKSQKINEKNIKEFMIKYKWSKKSVLRLIELINIPL
jgi:glutaredoxin